jgi:hypothetical protein
MANKNEWEMKREDLRKRRKVGMEAMTHGQMVSIYDAFKTIKQALYSVDNMRQITLQDINELENAMYSLQNSFIIDDSVDEDTDN